MATCKSTSIEVEPEFIMSFYGLMAGSYWPNNQETKGDTVPLLTLTTSSQLHYSNDWFQSLKEQVQLGKVF